MKNIIKFIVGMILFAISWYLIAFVLGIIFMGLFPGSKAVVSTVILIVGIPIGWYVGYKIGKLAFEG